MSRALEAPRKDFRQEVTKSDLYESLGCWQRREGCRARLEGSPVVRVRANSSLAQRVTEDIERSGHIPETFRRKRL